MKFLSPLCLRTAVVLSTLSSLALATRPVENLGRGVVAVRASDEDTFVSWRLLGLDPDD
ncbi:hypothetical protein FZEAL_9068, partial [Fusarium zealandicum]